MDLRSLVLLVDLDGTLVDSEDANHRAFVQIFREFDLEDRIPVVIEGLATGRDFAAIMEEIGLDSPTRRRMEVRMEEIVQAEHLHVMPGAEDAIRLMRKAGAKFSIATLNMSNKAHEILRANQIDDLFEPNLVIGSDNLPWEKPNPKIVTEVLRRSGRPNAIVVGNAPRDVMLAKNCNLPVIYLRHTASPSGAPGAGDRVVEEFQARMRELEAKYDHPKLYWADSWADVPGIVEKIATGA